MHSRAHSLTHTHARTHLAQPKIFNYRRVRNEKRRSNAQEAHFFLFQFLFFFRCLKWTRSCIAFVRVGTGITTEPSDTNLAHSQIGHDEPRKLTTLACCGGFATADGLNGAKKPATYLFTFHGSNQREGKRKRERNPREQAVKAR